jgi:adenylylsulfate kinase-like enzyme
MKNINCQYSPVIWLTGMSGSGKSALSRELKLLFLMNK